MNKMYKGEGELEWMNFCRKLTIPGANWDDLDRLEKMRKP